MYTRSEVYKDLIERMRLRDIYMSSTQSAVSYTYSSPSTVTSQNSQGMTSATSVIPTTLGYPDTTPANIGHDIDGFVIAKRMFRKNDEAIFAHTMDYDPVETIPADMSISNRLWYTYVLVAVATVLIMVAVVRYINKKFKTRSDVSNSVDLVSFKTFAENSTDQESGVANSNNLPEGGEFFNVDL